MNEYITTSKIDEIHRMLVAQNHLLTGMMLIVADIGIGLLPKDSYLAKDITNQVAKVMMDLQRLKADK
jgi:hypothetical protein